MPRARVFISCGQRDDLGEIATAEAIATALKNEGFDPYIAIRQQTLRGLKENIFEKLADAEYFLFIDFRREQLVGVEPANCRGSVFTQQELAIAAYLDTEPLMFQEEGVRPREGILAALQANCLSFADRASLPTQVINEGKQRGWNPNWQNSLALEGDDPALQVDALRLPENIGARFFHIRVRNNHRHKTARNAFGYLVEAVNLNTAAPVPFESVEFKWAGYTEPNATIAPGKYRKLDALWLPHHEPRLPKFNTFADSSQFIPQIAGVGDWQLTYEVLSDNIPGARRSFHLHLGGTLHSARFETI
jgi:hypothetical protein